MKKFYDVKAVIIRQPFEFAGFGLLGRSLSEYAAAGIRGIPYTSADCEGVLEVPDNFDYLAVIYADMPLVTADVLYDTARYMREMCFNRVNFGRGYMVSAEGLDSPHADRLIKADDFLSVSDTVGLRIVYNELRQRIISRLNTDGVIVLGGGVTVDDTAIIGRGAVLSGVTSVCGSSIVGARARLDSCYIKDSIIAEDEVLAPFSVIINKR